MYYIEPNDLKYYMCYHGNGEFNATFIIDIMSWSVQLPWSSLENRYQNIL